MRHGFFIAAWQVTVPEKKKPGAGNCTGNQDREAAASGCTKAICGTRSGPCGVRLGFGTCLSYPGCSGHPSQGDGWGQGERRASGDQGSSRVAKTRKASRSVEREALILLARQGGLEPPTDCLEGNCSIRLSYWRADEESLVIQGFPGRQVFYELCLACPWRPGALGPFLLLPDPEPTMNSVRIMAQAFAPAC